MSGGSSQDKEGNLYNKGRIKIIREGNRRTLTILLVKKEKLKGGGCGKLFSLRKQRRTSRKGRSPRRENNGRIGVHS